MNDYIMKELDFIYPELKGHWKACADDLIEKYDTQGKLHWAEAAIAEDIVNMKLEGRI